MQNNYLDIEIDLKNIEESNKPDLVVRIPRPRKRKLPEQANQVSEEFVKQSNPDIVANVNTLNRESFNMGEIKDDEDIEAAIKTVDWGDFDVNKLIELLCHLSQAITGIELKPYQLPIQRRIFKSIILNEGLTITALISRQAGKCLKKGTKVIMLDGSLKAVEDVKVGDKLLGPDSTPREVLSTTKGVDKLYTVTPKSGYALPYTVNSEHILVFTDRNSRELHKIKPKEYLNSTKYKREEFYRGIRAKVDFPKQDLPIDPYFLGVWLGDGDSSKPTITTPDKELINYIQDFATSLSMRVSFEKTNRNCERLHIVRTETSGNNRLLDMLRGMNLIDNKHIPLKYLAGNEEDRYKLLAGLIDTDGHKPSKKGKEATLEITFANKTLAEQTCFLARSLGFRVSIKEKLARIKSINYECIVYRISIYGETWKIPTKVKRKTSTPIVLRENTLTYGVSIVEEEEGEYYGFSLDKDHLFLLEDFTITHNSEAAACSITTLCTVMPALAKHFPEQLGTYKHGFMVGIYAPSGEQAKTLYDRVKARAHSESALAVYEDPDISTGIDRHGCKWKNGSFVLMQSASPKSNVESKSFHLIICVEENTQVLTPTGQVKIKDISVGDKVISYNETAKIFEEDTVVGKWFSGEKEVFEVELFNGKKIQATSEHYFLTNLGWVKLKELNINTHILICNNDNQHSNSINIGVTSRGSQYVQNVETDLSNKSTAWYKATRICASKVRGIKTFCINSAKNSSESRVWKFSRDFFNSLFTRTSEVLRPMLFQQRKEISYEGMVRSDIAGRISLLVYGRWFYIQRWILQFCYPQFFFIGAGTFDNNAPKVRGYCYNVYRQKEKFILFNAICEKSRHFIRSYISLYNPFFEIQTILKTRSNLSRMREAIRTLFKKSVKLFQGMSVIRQIKIRKILNFVWVFKSVCKTNILPSSRRIQSKSSRVEKEESRIHETVQRRVQGKEQRNLKSEGSRVSKESFTRREDKGEGIQEELGKIKAITFKGRAKTYDIKVAKNRNFIGNGIVVHNCDESQDLDDFVINKSIYPMLAWGNGTMVMIGTVSEKPCLFYDTIQQNVAEDVNRSAEDKCHFEYRWDEVIKHNPKYRVHIDNMKKKHGEHSKYFQMAYNLKWYFEEGRAITDLDLKQYTMGIKVGLTQYTNSAVVIGIDLARKTNGSVVTVGQLMNQEAIFEDGATEKFVTVKVCDWLEIEDIPYPQQRPLMKDFISRYPNVVAIAVDCTGVGDAIFSEMQEEWDFYCQMIPFIFSSKSKHQLMNLFYEFMWKNRLIIPSTEEVRKMNKWQRFYLQMVNLERVNQNGYTYLAKPTRNSARDDYPDSLFLMLHAAKEAIKNNGKIETFDVKNLYRMDAEGRNPNGGFEAFRENIRSGNYNKGSLRDQRVNKLMKGIV